jgi:nitroreductase
MKQESHSSRKPDYPIDSLFIDRWSPRAMAGKEISHEELMTLFEAARWAPSSYNNQPWRFIFATRGSKDWPRFLSLLVEFNQTWAQNAAALIVMISKKTFDNGKPSITHSFDAGAAWQNLALQGSMKGLAVRGMQGFDYEMAKQILEIPAEYQVQAMAAVGVRGKKEDLPEPLQKKESPSSRKPLSETVFEGVFRP